MLSSSKMGLVLLLLGAWGIGLTVFYGSTVSALVGLTFVFWGCLLMLVLPKRYVECEVVDSLGISSLSALNRLISDFRYQGRPVYIPISKGYFLPEFIDLRNEFVYVPVRNVEVKDAIEESLTRNPEGLRLIPPGFDLANLMEKRANIIFQNAKLEDLREILPSVIVRDLGIADKFEIQIEGNNVYTETSRPACSALCTGATEFENVCPNIGCPFSSSVACILTRVTSRPIVIEQCKLVDSTFSSVFIIL